MSEPATSTFSAYRAGFMATWTSVFAYVLFGTYIGIGALGHDFGFSLAWTGTATLLVGGGPPAEGRGDAADDQTAGRARLEALAAGAFHRRQPVGRGDAAAAEGA